MTPQITIVERTAKVSVLGHLDELERLMKIFVNESDASSDQNLPDALKYRMYLASFLIWLRQRQRESVAGEKIGYDYEGRDPMCSAGES